MSSGEYPRLRSPTLSIHDLKFPESKDPIIQVESWSNGVRTVLIRGFTKNALVSHDHVTNGNRSLATTSFRLTEMPEMLIVQNSTTGVQRGDLFIRVTLQFGGFDVAVLMSGYVTDDVYPSYPSIGQHYMFEGHGKITNVLGNNPAAGAECSDAVNTNAKWRLMLWYAIFTADATATTREPSLVFDQGGNILAQCPAASSSGASDVDPYTFAAFGAAFDLTDTFSAALIPPDIILEQGHLIRTVTNDLAAGDNWGAPRIFYEEWLTE